MNPPLLNAMVDDDQINMVAYHAEKVASRRLAKRNSISAEAALREILEKLAGADGLLQLLVTRREALQSAAARLSLRRQNKHHERLVKLNKAQLSVESWQAWFDGSARPNPGRCGIGCVLKGPAGEHVEICQDGGFGNSSDAEYRALLVLLTRAVEMNARPLVIYGDSQVVINDVVGSDGAAALALYEYRSQALSLLAQLVSVDLRWIPRHKNKDADLLSQRASS